MKKQIDINRYKNLIYIEQLPFKEVAKIFNVSVSGLIGFRNRHNLPTRGWGKNIHPMLVKHTISWNKGIIGKNSSSWKGGKHINSQGYISIYNPTHPSCKNNKYVAEHRLIMEKNLGRFLNKNEQVHHINGNKSDNRIENLIVLTNSEHIKSHPECLFKKGHIFHSRSLKHK